MVKILSILIIVLFFVIIGAVCAFGFSYGNYKSIMSQYPARDSIIIPFVQFKQWHLINPERYVLDDSYVKILVGTKSYLWGYPSEYEYIWFNYRDYRKYRKFKKQLDNDKVSKAMTKANIKILEAVQQDINNLRKQANKEIEHGAKQSIDIQKRLEEDIKLKC